MPLLDGMHHVSPYRVPGDFSERRTGLDHLGFRGARPYNAGCVAGPPRRGRYPHSGIKRGSTGDLIAFRDPDNIQLEFYTR